jgi:glutathione S-transferase
MLTLYFKQNCPFCSKVLDSLHEDIAADFRVFYKQNKDNEEVAKEIGGKGQYPLLVDENQDVIMYESDDIIDYLKKNYGH